MKIRFFTLLAIGCLLGQARAATSSLAIDETLKISFYLPEPSQRMDTPLDVDGKTVDAIVLGANRGPSAFFIAAYIAPTKDPAEAIEKEIARSVANVEGRIVSRQKLSDLGYPAVEVIARSSRSKTLTVRCRVICDAQRIFTLTAITTDGKEDDRADVERFFATFRIEKKNG